MLLGRWPPCAEKANRRVRSTPPPTVMRLFVSAVSSGPVRRVKSTLPPAVVCLSTSTESTGPVFGMGARAHESCSLGVDLYVRRRRTAARGACHRLR
jgi:hypothetical protein